MRWNSITFILLAWASTAFADQKPFRIQVVDGATGRGVPLVELKTVNEIRFYTDSNGVVAFDEPGLMNQSVFFSVRSHGYEFPKDSFGSAGKALLARPGGEAILQIKRVNIAQRLYRVSGEGIYRDSVLTGGTVPAREPLLNGLVMGCDSVLTTVYRGKIYWFWGDTNRPSYPLGNFDVPGATSELPGAGGLDPNAGVDLTYFVDDQGFARPTARMAGAGPTWLDSLVVLRGDDDGRERMFGSYAKVKPPLEVYQRGMTEFDDATQSFEKIAEFPADAPIVPSGHSFLQKEDGTAYVYFCHPYPLIRVRANPASLPNLAEYEACTCLKPGSRLSEPQIDRTPDGKIRYSWKKNTPIVGPVEQKKLVADKRIRPEEGLLQLTDRDTGKAVIAHHGSVAWNEFRKRWVMITVEVGGKSSNLGEVWYAEADSPLGPWAYAQKVVTHDQYSFYNPKHHAMFDQNGGRTIYFEGTYTRTFSGNSRESTPRYEYNQIMYRLDLDDPRLNLPVAVSRQRDPDRYVLRAPGLVAEAAPGPDLPGIEFFACERQAEGLMALCQKRIRPGELLLDVAAAPPQNGAALVGYVLPADARHPTEATVLLYEIVDGEGRHEYVCGSGQSAPANGRPLCRVWRSPWRWLPSK